MRRYLERALSSCRYAQKLVQHSDAMDKIFNQTLFELFHNLNVILRLAPKTRQLLFAGRKLLLFITLMHLSIGAERSL